MPVSAHCCAPDLKPRMRKCADGTLSQVTVPQSWLDDDFPTGFKYGSDCYYFDDDVMASGTITPSFADLTAITGCGDIGNCGLAPTGFLITFTGVVGCCELDDFAVSHQRVAEAAINDITFFVPAGTPSSGNVSGAITIFGGITRTRYTSSTCTGSPFSTSDADLHISAGAIKTTTDYDSASGGAAWIAASIPSHGLFGFPSNPAYVSDSATVGNSFFDCTPIGGITHYAYDGSATVVRLFTHVTLSGTSATFSNAAQSGSFDILTATDTWYVSRDFDGGFSIPNNTWLTITSSTSGTGAATVTFSMTANGTGSSRSVTIYVMNKPYLVTQNA